MFISIGIPSYNEHNNIINLLKSIENQRIPENVLLNEIIIYDESTDDTPKIIENYAASNHSIKIRIISANTRHGVSFAWNKLLHELTTDFIILLDADVILSADFLEKILHSFTSYENIALVCCNYEAISNNTKSSKISTFIGQWLNHVGSLTPINQFSVIGRAIALDKSKLKHIEIPFDIISADLYLTCKLHENGFSIIKNNNAKIYYKTPNNLNDLYLQTIRGIKGHRELKLHVDNLPYNITFLRQIYHSIQLIIGNKFNASLTLLFLLLLPFYWFITPNEETSNIWKTSKSTK